MPPTVSVVIPLYNKGPSIERAITSVLGQTVQEFEIIVMDGNSTDDGPEIVKNHPDPRIHLYVQTGSGVSTARNQGIEESQSEFIAFLDADDEWMPNHLETLWRLKQRFPDAGIYATAYKKCLKSGKLVDVPYRAIPKSPREGFLPNYFESAALGEPPVWTSAAGIMKKIYFEVGGFPVGESSGEDLDLWAKIALKYPVAFSSDITAVYHMEGSNRLDDNYHSIEEEPFLKTGKKALAEGAVPEKMLPYFKEYIARKEIDTAVMNIYAGDYPLARKILARTETRCHRLEKFKWTIITRIPKSMFDRIRYIKNSVLTNQ
jgi:glycosyltransferase involved in cell wall biosynthesis